MNEQRIQVFRNAIDTLVESLDATVRLSRWDAKEEKPAPLVLAASKLLERLGSADRLAASRFVGTAPAVAKVTAICTALKRLDAAYLAYVQQNGTDKAAAAAALEAEIAAATSTAGSWS